ncbi:MAG: hypothetical protein JWM91_2661 [Rhodospirillales bacterium]|nr:hypothetical protein [Rhodospirillales bacterium]
MSPPRFASIRAMPIGSRARVSVDDVLTTGAMVTAYAKVLGLGGAARIDVLSLARVVLAD